VVGLLDDNPTKVGRDIAGCVVMGTWDQVMGIARRTDCRHVIFATPGATAQQRRRAFDLCEKAGLELMVVPDLDQMIGSPKRMSEIRHIELDDLLGRDEVNLDTSGLSRQLGGKIVMVTGAGGSIGSELCRQIARFSPQAVVLFELNEFALYQIAESLERLHPELRIWPVVGDIKEHRRLVEVFERFKPTVVFHAAAYKHVPMLEELNSWEAVRNNTIGTRLVAETCAAHKVEKLVFVSTDKAVNPTNVMGATKRLAELMLQRIHLRTGLPVVSDAPVIGGLFRSTSRQRGRTNLMVFIRPTIIRSPDDAQALAADRWGYMRRQQLSNDPTVEPSLDEMLRDYLQTQAPVAPDYAITAPVGEVTSAPLAPVAGSIVSE
jgi:FlaA1/EpsC-like NDP-sugar epimerase